MNSLSANKCVQALFSVFHIDPNYLDFILNVKFLNVDRNTPFGQHFFMIVNSVLRASSKLIMYYWRVQYLRRFKNTLFRKRIYLFSLFYFALCSFNDESRTNKLFVLRRNCSLQLNWSLLKWKKIIIITKQQNKIFNSVIGILWWSFFTWETRRNLELFWSHSSLQNHYWGQTKRREAILSPVMVL